MKEIPKKNTDCFDNMEIFFCCNIRPKIELTTMSNIRKSLSIYCFFYVLNALNVNYFIKKCRINWEKLKRCLHLSNKGPRVYFNSNLSDFKVGGFFHQTTLLPITDHHFFFFFFFFLVVLGFGLWTQVLHLESLHQHFFCEGFFQDRVSRTVCSGLLELRSSWSPSWVARITNTLTASDHLS
jgi:hypothetical protein